MAKDTLTITDNRTGKTYEVPIENGCIRTNALRQIKASEDDFGLMGYDPAFLNTASTRSEIGYIDQDQPFRAEAVKLLSFLSSQSPEIAQGVTATTWDVEASDVTYEKR